MNWKLIRIIDSCLGIPILFAISLLGGRKNRRPAAADSSPRRILLIKFWGIGNIAMILPTIAAIRSAWPQGSIDFLTLESNRNALQTFDVVDSITTIDTAGISRFISSWRQAVATLSGSSYDIIIDFEQFARFSPLIARQIGGSRMIGFRTHGQHRHHLFTDEVEYHDNLHMTRSFFSLAKAAGVIALFPEDFTLPGKETLRDQGRLLLATVGVAHEEPAVVMHIGTSDNFRERRWPPEHYAQVADHLAQRYGARIVMTGLAEESFLIAETMANLRSPAAAVDLSGRLDFVEYASLIAAAGLAISADTAAVHLASALNVPVVGIYGPNTPCLYGPWGRQNLVLYHQLACSPCITNFNAKIHTCHHPEGRGACMRAISGSDACSAIDEFLAKDGNPLTLRGRA